MKISFVYFEYKDWKCLIEPSGVDYWIYGHHHQYIPEFEIGRTRLVTNQLGYVKYSEHHGFKNNKTIVL